MFRSVPHWCSAVPSVQIRRPHWRRRHRGRWRGGWRRWSSRRRRDTTVLVDQGTRTNVGSFRFCRGRRRRSTEVRRRRCEWSWNRRIEIRIRTWRSFEESHWSSWLRFPFEGNSCRRSAVIVAVHDHRKKLGRGDPRAIQTIQLRHWTVSEELTCLCSGLCSIKKRMKRQETWLFVLYFIRIWRCRFRFKSFFNSWRSYFYNILVLNEKD